MRLTGIARRAVARLLSRGRHEPAQHAVKPFDAEAPLPPIAGVGPLTRFEHAVWSSRCDLQERFDLAEPSGRRNFLAWRRRHLTDEYGWPEPAPFPVGPAEREQTRARRGLRLVGFARGELGLGENLRGLARACSLAAVPFEIVDVGDGIASRNGAPPLDGKAPLDAPLANLFLVNPDLLPRACAQLGRHRLAQARNVAYPFWELIRAPVSWLPALSLMDEIWVATRHVHDAIAGDGNPKVRIVPLPLAPPEPECLARSDFRLPTDAYVFLTGFDGLSGIERKNPAAVARAFLRAFPTGSERVRLVVKGMNVPDNPQWDDLADCARRDARIVLMRDTLQTGAFLALLRCCDCFVSLHRAEGLGRIPLEAMAMGKPVILTAHSGVLDYAREDNACLVDFNLVPIPAGAYPHAAGLAWAEPDCEHAAQWMRRLAAAPEWGRALGSVAADSVARQYDPRRLTLHLLERAADSRAS